ncbi:Gfo/Idh/MocA family oxidoreductase [Phytomonospora sp. NPDC050363]|uniref:Gfo/Idh/MocA family protein n=1 Tax=Phytomonospora sp. NPDC050363 TaxID=3155642 RepID=UPI0033CB8C16
MNNVPPRLSPIRVGLIGCGLIGLRHLDAWRQVHEASTIPLKITSVCDTDPARARAAADRVTEWQGSAPAVSDDPTDVFAGPVDGVDICLPVFLHERTAVDALKAGKHVLVEKPITDTIEAARRVLAAATDSGRVLALAENHRRSPAIRVARWLLTERQMIGAPVLVTMERSRFQEPTTADWHWRARKATGGGGWAVDNAAHLFDTLQYFFGPVEAVTAHARRVVDRPLRLPDGGSCVDEREDVLVAMLRFRSGVTGVFNNSSSLPGAERFHFAVQGTSGALVDDGGQLFHAPLPTAMLHRPGSEPAPVSAWTAEYLEHLDPVDRDVWFPYGLRDDFAIECAEFLRAMAGHGTIEIDGEQALRTLATSLAVYESALAGSTVLVDDVLSGRVRQFQETVPWRDGWK